MAIKPKAEYQEVFLALITEYCISSDRTDNRICVSAPCSSVLILG